MGTGQKTIPRAENPQGDLKNGKRRSGPAPPDRPLDSFRDQRGGDEGAGERTRPEVPELPRDAGRLAELSLPGNRRRESSIDDGHGRKFTGCDREIGRASCRERV